MAPVSVMRATDEDVAFAGAAAHRGSLVQDKQVSPSELVELYSSGSRAWSPR